MSDFDKEAERQKLREKFDRDKEKRKETERMSQLLLQGATMTNRHCDTCGDPLFRYQGQEFCATCQGRAQEEAEAQQAEHTQVTTEPTREGDAETTSADSTTTAEAETETNTVDADAAGHPTPPTQGVTTHATHDGEPTPETGTDTSAADSHQHSAATTPGQGRASADAGSDIATARASLVRTLTHHAQEAEASSDPRRATDHLTAAREAAEALSALDKTR